MPSSSSVSMDVARSAWPGAGEVEGKQGIINCWVCGRFGKRHSKGSHMRICPRHPSGDVIWYDYLTSGRKLNNNVVWGVWTVDAVDFTKPNAMSSPA